MANSKAKVVDAGTADESIQMEAEAPAKKKMSKEDAKAIVDKYSGINGSYVPDELKQARAALKG